MFQKNIPYTLALCVGVFVLSFLVGLVVLAAWEEPSAAPPEGNVSAPINVSGNAQTFIDTKTLRVKNDGTGILVVEGGLRSDTFRTLNQTLLATDGGKVGIGTTNPVRELHASGTILAEGGNVYVQSPIGSTTVAGLGELTNALSEWPGKVVYGLGWTWGPPLTIGALIPTGETFGIYGWTGDANLQVSGRASVGGAPASTIPKFSVHGASTYTSGMGVRSGNVWTIFSNIPGGTNNAVIDVTSGGTDTSIGTTGYNLLLNPTGGKVGIGLTTNPSDKFHVAGDIRVGTGTTGCVKDADATVIAGTCSSDIKLKKNIVPLSSILDKLTQLQPVSFNWRSNEYPELVLGNETELGLIAQEVEKIMPELVVQQDEFEAVRYEKMPMLLLQGIKELKAENDDLKARVEALEAKINNCPNVGQ